MQVAVHRALSRNASPSDKGFSRVGARPIAVARLSAQTVAY